MKVKLKLLNNGRKPIYKRDGDACLDCFSAELISIPKGERKLVKLGFSLELPVGYEAVVRPRSGLSKDGVDVCIGTIDSNYRGEVMACVINNKYDSLIVNIGDRICQIAIRKTEDITFKVVDKLSNTERGTNGFGSSGL